MNKRTTTIFRELILNVIIPVVISLLALAFLNYRHTKSILEDANKERNLIISDEIQSILGFQDVALEFLEEHLDKKMKIFSDRIVREYLFQNKDIENIDLEKVQRELGMDENMEDIYIINKHGIVVNTTFKKDQNLNFFDFGKEYEAFLTGIRLDTNFRSERFAIESSTKRLRKYSYQPTWDHEYIVEIGVYSEKADEIIDFIKNGLNNLSNKQMSISSVDLFIGSDKPFSLNKDAELDESHMFILKNIFKNHTPITEVKDENNGDLSYQYMYFERQNTDLYKQSVIRILSDRSNEKVMLRTELIKSLAIFLVILVIVIFMIYKKTQIITMPIKKLVENVIRITDGNLDERAEVEGNNEIAKLSEKFNLMIEELQSYYSELEQKVKDRTAEISKQKEEIEQQKDALAEKNKEITDSIIYAKRIQTAILPTENFVKEVLSNAFLYYRPKDIVSGDFYWVVQKDDLVIFAAVDCTGHGVPGAFMSIVGYNQLNNAVNIIGARKPSDILNALNVGVTESLRQEQGVSSVKDGMDIALCTYDTKTKKLQYAGANNPLYLICDGKLNITKADKRPIGAFLGEELKPFTNHEFDLRDGDAFYIFSDGYADQFGGHKGKKFKYSQFQSLLLQNQLMHMSKQKELLDDTIAQWIGDFEQVDDILVIGVKI